MTLKARKDICGNCLHHADIGGNNGEARTLECRFSPPTIFSFVVPVGAPPGVLTPVGPKQVQMTVKYLSAWPTLDPEKWCSKHAPEAELTLVVDNDG